MTRRALALLLLCASLGGCGITAPRHSEGYANLESLNGPGVRHCITLSFGPTLLHFAARHMHDDPATAQLLRDLDGVRVRIYEIDGDASQVSARVRGISEHLQAQGWEPVLLAREEQEETHMLLRIRDGSIRGLTVLSSDGVEEEAVVVNLIGSIQPAQFADVMLALDVDEPAVHGVRLVDSSD